MSETHIADDEYLFCLCGIRYVTKDDQAFPSTTCWWLDVAYKGQIKRVRYADKAKRDAMFDQLVAALTKPKPRRGADA